MNNDLHNKHLTEIEIKTHQFTIHYSLIFVSIVFKKSNNVKRCRFNEAFLL